MSKTVNEKLIQMVGGASRTVCEDCIVIIRKDYNYCRQCGGRIIRRKESVEREKIIKIIKKEINFLHNLLK